MKYNTPRGDTEQDAARQVQIIGEEFGATAVEYAILCSLIAGVVVVAVGVLGLTVKGLFDVVTW